MAPGVFQSHMRIPELGPNGQLDGRLMTGEQRAFASALRLQYAMHVEALSAGDVDSLLDFFTDDAVWMGSGLPTRVGRPQLRELFMEVAGTATVRCHSLHTYVDGNTGWDMVDYGVSPRDPSVKPWVFRTVFQWVRREERWLCNGVLCYPMP